MSIRFECPVCKNVHEIAGDNAGKNIVCKHCTLELSVAASSVMDRISGNPAPVAGAVEPAAVVPPVPIPLPPEPTHDLPPAAIDPAPNSSASPPLPEPKVVEWSDVEVPDSDSEDSDTNNEKPLPSTNRRTRYIQKKRRRSNRRLYFLIALTLVLLIASVIMVPAALERVRIYQKRMEKVGH
jgi:hypothetical protein